MLAACASTGLSGGPVGAGVAEDTALPPTDTAAPGAPVQLDATGLARGTTFAFHCAADGVRTVAWSDGAYTGALRCTGADPDWSGTVWFASPEPRAYSAAEAGGGNRFAFTYQDGLLTLGARPVGVQLVNADLAFDAVTPGDDGSVTLSGTVSGTWTEDGWTAATLDGTFSGTAVCDADCP